MAELTGTLDGLGLPAIIRFIGGLRKTGSLRLRQDAWFGEVVFDRGRVADARMGSCTGLAALDALVEAIPGADFEFVSSVQILPEESIELDVDQLVAHMSVLKAQLERGARRYPTPDAVPTLVLQNAPAGRVHEQLSIDRSVLQTLVLVDGRRSAAEIVSQRGSLDALLHLRDLLDIGLIRFGAAPLLPVERLAPQVQLQEVSAPEQCPKLGFEDDPSHSFGRPTRLHRCFASSDPQPLPLDQQASLCLSKHFEGCPRLVKLSAANPKSGTGRARPPWQAEQIPAPAQLETADPRIVRLPFAGRSTQDRLARLRVANGSTGQSPTVLGDPPRTRIEPAGPGAGVESISRGARLPVKDPRQAATASAHSRTMPPRVQARLASINPSTEAGPPPSRTSDLPLVLGVSFVVLMCVVAAAAYVLVPQLGSLLGDSDLDTALLPNTSRVAAGTPVSAVAANRLTSAPVARATLGAALSPTSQPTPVPTLAQPTPAPTPMASSGPITLLDEQFTSNQANWPNSPQGSATITGGTYRLTSRRAGQFVAVGAPMPNVPADVVISAAFRKIAGPTGGGYGIIVRDQSPAAHDGTAQDGQYYVFEVSDRGEVGIWRRNQDRWVAILQWQHSDAVHAGVASNDLSVRAIGSQLTFTVNGSVAASMSDATLPSGGVGLFLGGDGNQVAVDRFVVQKP